MDDAFNRRRTVLYPVAAGVSLAIYLDLMSYVCVGVLRYDLMNAVSLMMSYSVVSLCCFWKLVREKTCRRKILSSRFMTKNIDFYAIGFCSLTMVGIPHALLLFAVTKIDIEVVSIVLLLFYVICLLVDKLDVNTFSLLSICAGGLIAVQSFNLERRLSANVIPLGAVLLAISSFLIGVAVFQQSSLSDDIFVSSVLLMLLPVVISWVFVLSHISLMQALVDIASLSVYMIPPLFVFGFVSCPCLVVSTGYALSMRRFSVFGLGLVFQCSYFCLRWSVKTVRKVPLLGTIRACIACVLLWHGGVRLSCYTWNMEM